MQKAIVKFKALSQLTKNGFNTNSKNKFKPNIEKNSIWHAVDVSFLV